jgi:hypothetical protein
MNENTGLEYMPSDMKCHIVWFSMLNTYILMSLPILVPHSFIFDIIFFGLLLNSYIPKDQTK